MRLAPDDVRRTRLRRGSLVGVTSASVAALLVSAFVPALEPWFGPARVSLLLLACTATTAALVALLVTRHSTEWSSADDVAWVIALGVLSVLAGASSAPVGLGMVFEVLALLMLAARAPSGTLVVIAFATTAFAPIVRALLVPSAALVVPAGLVALIGSVAFASVTLQTRRLARALGERDALAAANARSATAAPAAATTSVATNSTAVRISRVPMAAADEPRAASTHDAADHGWDALVERLRASVLLIAENAGVDASVEAELAGLAPPSTKMRTNLLRIAQEATTQALRHAGPRSIVVTLRRADGGVVLELLDDGVAGEGMRQRRSIATLKGRVAALGGTAELRRSDTGWVTRVRLPCEQLN